MIHKFPEPKQLSKQKSRKPNKKSKEFLYRKNLFKLCLKYCLSQSTCIHPLKVNITAFSINTDFYKFQQSYSLLSPSSSYPFSFTKTHQVLSVFECLLYKAFILDSCCHTHPSGHSPLSQKSYHIPLIFIHIQSLP